MNDDKKSNIRDRDHEKQHHTAAVLHLLQKRDGEKDGPQIKAKVEALETFAQVYGKAYAVPDIELKVERFIRNVRYLAKRNGGIGVAEAYAGVRSGYLSRQMVHRTYKALPLAMAIALAEFVGESVEDLYTRDDYLTREIDDRIEELQAQIAELEDEKRRTTV